MRAPLFLVAAAAVLLPGSAGAVGGGGFGIGHAPKNPCADYVHENRFARFMDSVSYGCGRGRRDAAGPAAATVKPPVAPIAKPESRAASSTPDAASPAAKASTPSPAPRAD